MTFVFSIFLAAWFFISPVLAVEPVEPTKDLQSRSAVKDVEPLNLPYRPKDIEGVEGGDPMGENPNTNGGILGTEGNKEEIDWSRIPFIPSKYPLFEPAKDPEI